MRLFVNENDIRTAFGLPNDCEISWPMCAAEMKQCLAYLNSGEKLQAIKVMRDLTGCGLKTAKDIIDLLDADMRRPRV